MSWFVMELGVLQAFCGSMQFWWRTAIPDEDGILFVPYSHWVTIRVMYYKMLIQSDFDQILPLAHYRCLFQIRFLQTNLQKSSTMHLWKVCQKTLCCGGGCSMSWWPGICWWLLWWIEETYLNRLAGVGKGPITRFNIFLDVSKLGEPRRCTFLKATIWIGPYIYIYYI